MNMTSSGIGWGVTQNITNYTGGTIKDIPIGCVVTVRTGWRNSSLLDVNANFSGTFAKLNLNVDNNESPYTTVGSSLILDIIGSRRTTDEYGDRVSQLIYAGTFLRLS